MISKRALYCLHFAILGILVALLIGTGMETTVDKAAALVCSFALGITFIGNPHLYGPVSPPKIRE